MLYYFLIVSYHYFIVFYVTIDYDVQQNPHISLKITLNVKRQEKKYILYNCDTHGDFQERIHFEIQLKVENSCERGKLMIHENNLGSNHKK